MKKIRMGIIGTGGISAVHMWGTKNSPDAELVAFCDINEKTLKAKADQFEIPEKYRFNNHIDLLECPDIDAVSISTPNNCHYQIAMDAVRHGKPFCLEKPVTITYEEAKTLNWAARDAGVPNMVCFSYRFKAAARFMKSIIESGQLGKIYHIYGQYLQSYMLNPSVPLVWRLRKEIAGSGVHGDLGCHLMDLVRFMTSKEYVKICAHADTFIKQRKMLDSDEYGEVDVDDFCHILIGMEDGISGTLCTSRYAYARGNYQRIEIYGDKGTLEYNLEDEDSIEVCMGEAYREAKTFVKLPVPQRFKVDQMQSFFDIINGKGDGLAATMADGEINQLAVCGVIESFEKEKWIYLENQQ